MHHAYLSIRELKFMCAAHIISPMKSTANILGALALSITDQIHTITQQVLARSGETSAAIIIIGYVPGISVEVLRQVLGLSHPGTVRLIDRLRDDGYVERQKAKDGRAVALHLTQSGNALRTSLMEARLDLLQGALDGLSTEEQQTLGTLLAKVLKTLPESEMDKHRICRLCSVQACPDCPIRGNAI